MSHDDKVYYSYEQIEDACRFLADDIASSKSRPINKFDLIIGVSRGGLFPAIRLSYLLDIPMYAINYSLKDENRDAHAKALIDCIPDLKSKRVLIVEDIADTGDTLLELATKHFSEIDYRTVVLIYKTCTSKYIPNFKAFWMGIDKWVVFPWES